MNHVITTDELRRRAGILNIAEAAAVIGIEPRRFRYQLESGRVGPPLLRIGSKARRYYTSDDVEEIGRCLKDLAT